MTEFVILMVEFHFVQHLDENIERFLMMSANVFIMPSDNSNSMVNMIDLACSIEMFVSDKNSKSNFLGC
jgi:intracellular sulfur oxidation DsrE/DsrF family protein